MNKITTIFLLLFLISFTSAITVQGEPETITLEELYNTYSVIGNSTAINLTELIEKNDTSYEIVDFNSKDKTVTVALNTGYKPGEVIFDSEEPEDSVEVVEEVEEKPNGFKWVIVFTFLIMFIAVVIFKNARRWKNEKTE